MNKQKLRELVVARSWYDPYECENIIHSKDVLEAVDQLEWPETLTEDWIKSMTSPVDDEGRLYVFEEDLKNIIWGGSPAVEAKLRKVGRTLKDISDNILRYYEGNGAESPTELIKSIEVSLSKHTLIEKETRWVVKSQGLYFKNFRKGMDKEINWWNTSELEDRMVFQDRIKADAVAFIVDGEVEEISVWQQNTVEDFC